MATIDFTSAVARRWAPGGWQPGVFHLFNKVDFSVTNGGSGDTIECLPIPAGTLVTQVFHIVDTAEGGTSTATVGDGDDPNGWIASANNNATAGTVVSSDGRSVLTDGTPNTFDSFTNAYHPGHFYSADDTIDMVLSANAVDTAVIKMVAVCVELDY